MIYGLTGSHRSGKTTLARKIADDMGLHFLKIETTEVAKANGFDPVAPMSYGRRAELQLVLFDDFCKQLAAAPRPVITDRTPLDHIAYLLAETTMLSGATINAAQMKILDDFIGKALDFTVQSFDTVFALAPLPNYEVAPDKPPPNIVYQFGYAATIWGLLYTLRDRLSFVSIENADFEVRTDTVATTIAQRLNWIQHERSKAAWIH